MLTGDHLNDFAPGETWDLNVEGFGEEPNTDKERDPPGTGREVGEESQPVNTDPEEHEASVGMPGRL